MDTIVLNDLCCVFHENSLLISQTLLTILYIHLLDPLRTTYQHRPYFEGACLDALRASPRRPLLEMRNPEAPSLRDGPKKERPSSVSKTGLLVSVSASGEATSETRRLRRSS